MNVICAENIGVKFEIHHNIRRKLRKTLLSPFSYLSIKEEFWAVKNVSFTAQKGDIFGIIGKNGAGKSTLLRILAGIYAPDEGNIKTVGKISPLLSLGAGFQPDLSGKDNIYLNGVFLGLGEKKIAEKYDSIVEFAELERFIDTPVRNYSSGMIARLAFSIAINVEPDILLIDEILGVGDEKFREKSKKKMREFMKKAEVIFICTHNIAFVQEFCNKAIWLDAGRIGYIGKPEETVRRYLESIR